MKQVVTILLGPALMTLASLALGRLFLRGLRVRLWRGEERALEFIAGAGLLSVLVALAGAAHQARKGVFVCMALAAIALCVWRTRARPEKALPAAPRLWVAGFALVLAVFSGLYLLRAVGPELAGGERLGLAYREWEMRRLTAPPEPMRMLFLFVFSMGKHPAAAVAHFAFLLALPLAIFGYTRRFGFPKAGVLAGLLVFLAPAAAVVGTSALDDLAVAAFLFAAFYLLEVYRQGGGRGALAAAVVMAGFALWLRHPLPPAPVFRGLRVLALTGTEAGGLLGPLYLLAPVALLALRYREGRRLLAAAALAGLPGLAGGEARWLIPALPFLALAMSLAFRNTPGALAALAVAQTMFCWPPVTGLHADVSAWRIHQVQLAPALRRVPEEQYLNERLPGYVQARLVQECVPPGARVFAMGEVARAYTTREIVSDAALRDAVLTPLRAELQAARLLYFSFPAGMVRALRVRGARSVTEFRVLAGGREIPRAPGWRLRAHPVSADAGAAFDNSYVTRWAGAGALAPYLEVDFPAAVAADSVLLECPREQGAAGLSVEGRMEDGGWRRLAGEPAILDVPPSVHLREAAAEELKARGIGYLLVRNEDEGAGDFRSRSRAWHILREMELYDAVVYRVE